MLDKKVFMTKMDELLTLFPDWGFDKSNGPQAAVWYKQFTDLSDKEFEKMVDVFIANEKFNPTVGGLRQYIVRERQKTQEQLDHEQMLKENGLV